jgi:hypothetical protein
MNKANPKSLRKHESVSRVQNINIPFKLTLSTGFPLKQLFSTSQGLRVHNITFPAIQNMPCLSTMMLLDGPAAMS